MAHLIARRFQEAIRWVDEALLEAPRLIFAMRVKLAACGHLGRIGDARECLARLLERQRDLTIAKFTSYASRFVLPEVLQIYVDGLRKAGLPEE
jgi:hypothetical protein